MPLESKTREYCSEQVRGVDREKRTIEIIFSDYSLDTYNTRFDQSGWDFERFKKNPVILACHNDRKFVIARGLPETIRVVGQQSTMKIQFPDEGKHPEADIAFNLYADGFMRGVSVGFWPIKWDDIDEEDSEGRPIRVRIFRKQRLDEVSLVAIPSNENALAKRCAQMNADPEAIKQRAIAYEQALAQAPEVKPIDPAEHEKYRAYFEKKQPANKAATGVLKRFFEKVGEKQPDDETAAWNRMAELVDQKAEEPEVTPEPVPEPVPAPVEVKPEEKTPEAPAPVPQSTPPAPEAPEPERKASVLVPLDLLMKLPAVMAEQRVKEAVEALQRGKSLKGVLKSLGK